MIKKIFKTMLIFGTVFYLFTTTLNDEEIIIIPNNNEYKEEEDYIFCDEIKNNDAPLCLIESSIEDIKEDIKEEPNIFLTEEEWECLYRVARAEAGAWSKEAQKNVVYVVLNRVNSDKFPNSIHDVVFEKGQFACIPDGHYFSVEISDFLIENVEEAYYDYVEGESAAAALFFTLGYFNREYLFTDEVGHNFFK